MIVAAPNSIYFQKNYNSGKVVANETKADAGPHMWLFTMIPNIKVY